MATRMVTAGGFVSPQLGSQKVIISVVHSLFSRPLRWCGNFFLSFKRGSKRTWEVHCAGFTLFFFLSFFAFTFHFLPFSGIEVFVKASTDRANRSGYQFALSGDIWSHAGGG